MNHKQNLFLILSGLNVKFFLELYFKSSRAWLHKRHMDRVTLYKYPWKRILGAKNLDLTTCHFIAIRSTVKITYLEFWHFLPDFLEQFLLCSVNTDCTIQASCIEICNPYIRKPNADEYFITFSVNQKQKWKTLH